MLVCKWGRPPGPRMCRRADPQGRQVAQRSGRGLELLHPPPTPLRLPEACRLSLGTRALVQPSLLGMDSSPRLPQPFPILQAAGKGVHWHWPPWPCVAAACRGRNCGPSQGIRGPISCTSLFLSLPNTYLPGLDPRFITKSTRSQWRKWTAWPGSPTVWSSGEHSAAPSPSCM